MDKIPFKNSMLFKEFKNRNRGGYVDRQQVTSFDQSLFFLQTKTTYFFTRKITVNEVNNDCIFVMFPLFVSFSTELDE